MQKLSLNFILPSALRSLRDVTAHAPHFPILGITPPVRAHARYAIFPGNSCFLFVENFPFSARRIYTPFIDRLLEKDYNEGW